MEDGKKKKLAPICYVAFEKNGAAIKINERACLEEEWASDLTGEACNANACWCQGDDCNTEAWFTKFHKEYKVSCILAVCAATLPPQNFTHTHTT